MMSKSKIKTILQSESKECGLACLAMIASHHQYTIGLATLRRRFLISIKGTTLADIIRYAQEMGFSCRALRLELEDINKLSQPCILHWNLNHFVVLEKVNNNRLHIIDPANGARKVDLNEASKSFTGIALELTPNQPFYSAKAKPRINIRALIGHIIGLKRSLFNIFVLMLAMECIALLSPQVTQWVIDGALTSADYSLLTLAVLGGSILLGIDFILRVIQGRMMLRIQQQLVLQWTGNLLNHLLNLPWPFFEKRQLGDIVSRFESLHAIRNLLTSGAISALLDGLVILITLGMMLLYSTTLTIIVLIGLKLYGVTRILFYFPLRTANEQRIILAAQESSYFLETIRAIQPIKLFNISSLRLSNWKNKLIDVQNRDIATQKIQLTFSCFNTFIFGLEGMALLYIGGVAVLDHQLSLGMLLAFIAYKNQFTQRASKLIDLGIEVKMLSLHAERLADIALEEAENENTKDIELSRIEPKIEMINVSYRYANGEPWIIRDLSLTIPAGESVAIVGHSGCGKSTLFKLILGLISPTEGEIRIGGIPIEQLGKSTLRNIIGTVMQNDQLVAGSIAENISCFDIDQSEKMVEDSATKACIHQSIIRMPMGYQTLLGEMGDGLSGGQRQRILLARALYKHPKILALDEATSHLDLHCENNIVYSIKKMPITKIIIAHRRETILMADRCVMMENGKITEDITMEQQ